jgi:hypothetical protein
MMSGEAPDCVKTLNSAVQDAKALGRALAEAEQRAYERGRKEGIEEAAKVAFKQAPATQDWADAPLQDQAKENCHCHPPAIGDWGMIWTQRTTDYSWHATGD